MVQSGAMSTAASATASRLRRSASSQLVAAAPSQGPDRPVIARGPRWNAVSPALAAVERKCSNNRSRAPSRSLPVRSAPSTARAGGGAIGGGGAIDGGDPKGVLLEQVVHREPAGRSRFDQVSAFQDGEQAASRSD